MQALVGRDHERDVAATFVAASASGPAVLTIDGEAGIGKTTLFRYGVDLARAAGSTVLDCSPTSAESSMSFVGLTDMLRHVPASAFDSLPAPQRHSLAVATLRETPTGSPLDERAVGTGLAALLSHLAESAPLVLAVDDLQWLDRPSADVLTFAARRFGEGTIGMLTCERTGEVPTRLADAVTTPHWHESLTLAGLSAAALFHVVRGQLDITLPRPTLIRVAETSGGNPFAALELSRVIDTSAGTASGLRMSDLLQTLTAARLGQLSEQTRSALLAVACSPRPTLSMLGSLELLETLVEAESNGTVSLVGGRAVFTHPLLAAAVVQMASAPQQRAMHARLASAADGPEARARHQALAHPDPDEATAVALDEAARSAQARGSSIAAAELARLALDRTVDGDGTGAWTRRIRLAELLHAAGSSLEAGRMLEDRGSCPAGVLRARAGLILTEIAYQTSTVQRAIDLATAALSDAGDDPRLGARCLLSLAALATDGHETARFAAEARSRLTAAGIDDPVLLAWAECEDVSARFHMGEGLDRAGIDRALALERTGRSWTSNDQVASVRPVLLKWADHPHDALASLHELRSRADEEGNEGLIPYVLGHIPGILLRLGHVADAAAAAAEHLAHAESTGQESQRIQALYNVSLVDAHLGRSDQANDAANQIMEWALAEEDRWLEMSATSVLGFVALSRGDNTAARDWFDRWSNATDDLRIVDPGVSRFHGDHIEALVGCGAIDDATARTDLLEQCAVRAGRVSACAIAARCRALLAGTAGELTAALDQVEIALDLDSSCPVPFERHRTMMLKGVIHRRAKEKSAARSALTEAAAGFAALDAGSWADRCDQELRRIGTRASSPTALTATEQRIAELTATGLTNRQVAEQSFVSPKTVEANLARVYRKLGISSRAELGARMGNQAL